MVSRLFYNEISQVYGKHLHGTVADSVNGLQTITYVYNERGWLRTSSAPLFAMDLRYNTSTTVKSYNGNIVYQLYGTPGNLTNINAYVYDPLNRLISGNGAGSNNENGILYDQNGNITLLHRYQAGTIIDNLTYTYTSGGNSTNQLQSITDVSGSNTGLVAGLTSYTYDGNGNMLTQTNTTNTGQNKTLTYNLLNLPQTAAVSGGTITYTYDATGNKLRRSSPASGTTDYVAGIQYDGGNISFVQTEEGKAVLNGAGANYTYYLGDNLGNTRVTFETKTGSAVQIQRDDYYAFGMEINSQLPTPPTAKNEYLYNKKELQEELQQYDYGARFYDPVIGRWNTIDKYAEKYQSISSYSYVANNPIIRIDMKGDTIIEVFTSDYTKTGSPTKMSDLAGTSLNGDIGIYGTPTTSNINISVPIKTSYSSAFEGVDSKTNIEQQNPGLKSEVDTHEKNHEKQIMTAANLPVSITVVIDGKPVTITGTADNVILQGQTLVNATKGMTGAQKARLLVGIGTDALTQMNKNIEKAENDPNVETDAINKTNEELGEKAQYSNGKKNVKYQGTDLQNDYQ